MIERTVADLKKGETAVIKGFRNASLSLRLLEMGCLPGSEITLDFLAPLGCPVGVRVLGYKLSMRKSEADSILIEH